MEPLNEPLLPVNCNQTALVFGGSLASAVPPDLFVGCGKRTVVRYVAHRLGLFIMEVSCHDLMSSSVKKAYVALANTFRAAHSIKGPELINVYIGELKKNVRDIFQKVSQNDIDASINDGADSAVVVEIDDFIKALAELSPSLSLTQVEKYEQLRYHQLEGTRK